METLEAAFDPDFFRAQGHAIVDMLAEALTEAHAGAGKVLPWVPPSEQVEFWKQRMESPTEDLGMFLAEFAGRSIAVHHPRYMGHQVCAPAPAAALAGLVAELLNNGMAVYEMGPAATGLERWIVRRVCGAFGFEKGEGFLTSGGTLGALTALLAARARKLGDDAMVRGTENRWAVMASGEAHYCTSRAALVMGWGREALVSVPVDEHFKMRADSLDECYDAAVARGRTPVILVASACSTSTGSYDDLNAAADFCERRGLWLHVDGAHGAAVAFCPELRGRIAGIERADSAILDFHKLLLTPALATAVVFREAEASWAAFAEKAQYLFAEGDPEPWRDSGRRTMECTKLSMSVKIAAIWRAHGEGVIAEHLREVHGLARDLAKQVRARAPFECAVEPESNIVCFRLRPDGMADDAVDALNSRVRKRVIEGGEFYIVQTTLRGRTWLRTALMNPFTTPGDLAAMLNAVAAAAR